jgi:AcrR family transcriptional regulator
MEIKQLPRGRHGLSRQDVARSQRERMLRAMAEAVSELGYVNTPVAQVLRRAGVSRETFYEQFTNKEQCFLAAYDATATTLLQAMVAERDSEPPARGTADELSRALARYLAALAREPALARTFLVEVYAAGPAALARRVQVQSRFVEALAVRLKAKNAEQRFACEAIVAAVSALATQRICAGRATDMRQLHGPLLRFAQSSLAGAGVRMAAASPPVAHRRRRRASQPRPEGSERSDDEPAC